MPLPATFWALLGLRSLVAFFCPRWPRVAFYAALAAHCVVMRAFLLSLPNYRAVIAADALLFVLPSIALAEACGVGPRRRSLVLLVVPLSLAAGALGPEWRRLALVLGTSFVQGASAAVGIREEFRGGPPSWERRAAVVLAAVGVLGGGLVRIWEDVAAAGAAAYAFVLFAYAVQRLREKRGDLRGLARAAEDVAPPPAEPSPRAEEVAEAKERPEARREDPGVDGRPEHPRHPPG